MSTEIRIAGPPGCGKSSRLATQEIPDAVNAFGMDKIVVTSFTKSGAIEIANKKSLKTGEAIPVNPAHVGTLHSLCYRQLGNPPIAETHKTEWNKEHGVMYPMTAMLKGDLDEGGIDGESGSVGEELLHDLNIYRNKQVPVKRWNPEVQSFSECWHNFKSVHGFSDFTDLIERGINELTYAPGRRDRYQADRGRFFFPGRVHAMKQPSRHGQGRF